MVSDRDRIAELEEEVLQLRALLGLQIGDERIVAMRRGLDIKPGEAKLLQVLLTRALLTRRLAERALERDDLPDYPSGKTVDVQLSRLRAVLRPLGVEIRNEHGAGWSINRSDRPKIEARIE